MRLLHTKTIKMPEHELVLQKTQKRLAVDFDGSYRVDIAVHRLLGHVIAVQVRRRHSLRV